MPDGIEVSKTGEEAKDLEIRIRNKAICAFILIMILFIPVWFGLFFLGRYYSFEREAELEQINQDILVRIAGYGNQQVKKAEGYFDSHIREEIALTTAFLKEYVTENVYAGPEILADGFVLRFVGDGIIYPFELSGTDIQASKNLIEESIESGTMRTGSVDLSSSAAHEFWPDICEALSEMTEDLKDSSPSGSLSFARISEDAVYAHITSRDEFSRFVDLYRQNSLSEFMSATEISGGMTMIAGEENGKLVLLGQFGETLLEDGLQDLGLTTKSLENADSGNRKVNGHRYRFTSTESDGEWLGYGNVYIIQVFLMDSMFSSLQRMSVLVCLLMLIFYITISTYSLSEEEYVFKHVLNTQDAEQYNPRRLRRRLCNLGIFSALIILLIAFLTQSVLQMRQHASTGQLILEHLTNQRNSIAEGMEETEKTTRENWYLGYGTQIASFLEGSPALQTEEKLRECSEIIGADFIMLFDQEGNELLCSKDYDGFTIDRILFEDSSDFRRLLLGMEGIIHEVSADKVTGALRQMAGVTVDLSGDDKEHGALILAFLPETSFMAAEPTREFEASLLIPRGVLCFETNKNTGEILFSSETSLTGETVEDIGLTSDSLKNGYMDFGTIRGIHRFIVSYARGSTIWYYAAESGTLRKENFLFGLASAILYVSALIVLLVYLVRGYDEKSYGKWAVTVSDLRRGYQKAKEDKKNSAFTEEFRSRFRFRSLNQKPSERRYRIKDFFSRISGWNTLVPEKRAGAVFLIGLFILLQLWIVLGLKNNLMTGKPLLEYLLYGDWMRGLNEFAVYCIFVCVAGAILVIIGSEWVLRLIAGFAGAKGATVCRLLQQIIRYVSIIVVAIMALHYLGLLNSQVLASMGIGSIAISLGAKDIISDILAGILIVFDEMIRVGDIVEYQGILAVVSDVRIRSTELSTIPDNDIMTVRNSAITTITNKSRAASVYNLKLKVRRDVSLEKIESIMDEMLPKIKEACPGIIGMPKYLGVVELGGGMTDYSLTSMMTVQVNTVCDIKDKMNVMVYMNRELHMRFAEEGIEVF